MDIFQRFKNYFLGISPNSDNKQDTNRQQFQSVWHNEENRSAQHPNSTPEHYFDSFGFNIFSSPLEMHRYFEHHMNEMLKNFGIFTNEDSFFGNFGNHDPSFGENPFGRNSFDSFQFPSIDDFSKESGRSGSLRDQYLKPGYEAIPNGHRKIDKDVDEKFDMSELQTVLKNTPPAQVQPKRVFIGQSVITKTIRNADGTLESHKTIKDQDGNEQTIITKRQGDKEYTVTTKTNKDGVQEIIENMVNLDEKEKENFLNRTQRKLTDVDPSPLSSDFPFNNFF